MKMGSLGRIDHLLTKSSTEKGIKQKKRSPRSSATCLGCWHGAFGHTLPASCPLLTDQTVQRHSRAAGSPHGCLNRECSPQEHIFICCYNKRLSFLRVLYQMYNTK